MWPVSKDSVLILDGDTQMYNYAILRTYKIHYVIIYNENAKELKI